MPHGSWNHVKAKNTAFRIITTVVKYSNQPRYVMKIYTCWLTKFFGEAMRLQVSKMDKD
jgi:hypothetical protein